MQQTGRLQWPRYVYSADLLQFGADESENMGMSGDKGSQETAVKHGCQGSWLYLSDHQTPHLYCVREEYTSAPGPQEAWTSHTCALWLRGIPVLSGMSFSRNCQMSFENRSSYVHHGIAMELQETFAE